MSGIEWFITIAASMVGISLGLQQLSTNARQKRKTKKEEAEARIRAQDQFFRDWAGEPERPGHPATPGVMERLQKIEGELKHNGGSSMKDAVRRIEQSLKKIEERIEKGDARFLEGTERFDKIESELEVFRKKVYNERT